MSWFARALSNTLKLDDDDNERHRLNESTDNGVKHRQKVDDDDSPLSPGRGVKEDLSEITETLTRKFWGVASLLAPPPPQELSNEHSESFDPESDAPEAISGLRRDFAEIGGRFRSGISKLSNNIDVTEITKMASTFLQLESKDEDYDSTKGSGAVGVTDEVVDFVRDIAMHPETWLDFPLPEEEDDDEDFDLSDAQYEHALKIEHLAPGLAALRIELCPGYMSESSFWKIYFVLLYPRLERQAAELLSTPEIVRARASLTQLRSTSYSENRHNSTQEEHLSVPSRGQSTDSETKKDLISRNEIQIGANSLIQDETRNKTKTKDQNVNHMITAYGVEAKDEDDTDDWLKEESSEPVNGETMVSMENDEDVSFSDLEEDDGEAAYGSDSNEHTGTQQVSSKNPNTNESNDWLDVDDIDIA